jgi:hypothetical protein
VRICSLYGAGFFYIPGTDTCIKLGGYLRAEMAINTNSVYTGNTSAQGGLGNRYTNGYTWRSREDLNIDTRTATEYGVVRTFFDSTFTWTGDTYSASGTNSLATVYSQLGALGVAAPNNAGAGNTSYGTLGVYYAFIQFAGFTMGKAVSPFDAQWSAYPGNNFDGLVGGGGTITGVNQFAYTANFGNGVSGTIAAVDQTQYMQAGILNLGAGGLATIPGTGVGFASANDTAGTVAPDIVGVLKVDQAWGVAQLSVAAHDNHAAYYNTAVVQSGHPDDKWGFAVQGALQIKNIPTGAGDVINVQGVYTDGATRYNIQNLAAGYGAWTTFGGNSSVPGTIGTVGIGVAPDTIFALNGQQQLIQTWGMRGAFNHNWDPYWSTALYGAWASIHYSGGAAAIACASIVNTAAIVLTPGSGCNPNYDVGQLGVIVRWTPVKNLTFSTDFLYSHLSQNFHGTISTSGGNGSGVYQIADQNTYQALIRAQRNF